MDRIIDANLNRATEALRVIEEISRFYLDDKDLSGQLKLMRHKLSKIISSDYQNLLKSRNTLNDVGIDITNPTSKNTIFDVYKANFKRLQQALRVLSEYSPTNLKLFEELRYSSYTLEKVMFEGLSAKIKLFKLHDRKLYLVTDRTEFPTHDEFLDKIASALKGGVQIVQLREKQSSAKEFIELARRVKQICAQFDAVFIINDRVDIAKTVEADGVHLGQDDIDIHSARYILGYDAIIGISTHSPDQATDAVKSGADYIGVGPVYETPTKPGRTSVGLEYVNWVSKNINIPWFAIGGINLDNVADVIEAGAKRIAVVRSIMNANNPENAAREFLKKLQ